MRHEIRVDKTRDMSCDGCLLTRFFALLSKLIINFSFLITFRVTFTYASLL